MEQKKDIMEVERVLPENFDGVFRFTNDSDEDFIGKWNSKEYLFKAHTTSPMQMLEHTPLEIQQIRKKFAMDWAQRELGKSELYKNLLKQERNSDGTPRSSSIHGAATYSIDQLTPYIQRCLKPLPESKAVVSEAMTIKIEKKLSRNEDGKLNTRPLNKNLGMDAAVAEFEKE